MQRHLLGLRYDGLTAEHGDIGASASKQVVVGAQMLLGAHAHYYLNEEVPDRIFDRGRGYEIMHRGRAHGSHLAEFVINIAANGVYDAAKLGFGMLLWHSYQAWSEGRLYENPPYERIEPYFESRHMNMPFVDDVERNLEQRKRLGQRVGKAMTHLTTPNGTFSSKLEMSIDGQVFATVTRRYYDEDDIAEAVRLLRHDGQMNRRLS